MRMMKRTRAFTRAIGYVWVLCFAALAGPPATVAAQPAAAAAQPGRSAAQPDTGTAVGRYEVQPSDRLQVSVWKEPELTQEVIVRPDGAFSFPLVGEVNAVGKTVEELRRELVQQLSRIIPDVVVTVSVLEIRGNKIYVIGQVNQPGEFIVNPRVDVMQALSLAGGTTAFASPSEIFVLRRDAGQQQRLPFNFDAVLRGRLLEQNVLLRSGDVVVVP
jgi:polysaccharide biosynthesis/export protein